MQLTALRYKKIDARNIELIESLKYQIGQLIITVPKGFISDGASTPRILWAFFPPWSDEYAVAAVVHDYLYSTHNRTGLNKELSDKIFDYIMQENGVSKIKRKLMYKAVASFGSVFFKPQTAYKQKALIDHTKEAAAYYKFWEKMLGFK